MHDNPNLFDDDDDSDSDWEPLEKHVEVKRWFCTNCTMLNFDDIVHCEVCIDSSHHSYDIFSLQIW